MGIKIYQAGEKLPKWVDKKRAIKGQGTKHLQSYHYGNVTFFEKKKR